MAPRKEADQSLLDSMTAQERADEDAASQMIGATEQEVFNYGADQQEDENDGDNVVEQTAETISDDDPAGEEDEEVEAEADELDPADVEAQDDGIDNRTVEDEREPAMVPSSRLRDMRRDHDAALARAREREDDLIRQIGRWQQPPPQPQPVPQAPSPDMFADPEGWTAWQTARITEQVTATSRNNFIQMSMDAIREENPTEFDFVIQNLIARKDDPTIQTEVKRIFASPNPGRELMKWGGNIIQEYRENRQSNLLNEVADQFGYTPDDIRRAMSLYERSTGRSPQRQQPQQQPRSRSMPSLNSAGGSPSAARTRLDPRGNDGSERSIFESAFTDR
jgi:hypothetical protein